MEEYQRLATELKRRQERNALSRYRPYTKQREFHGLGLAKRERLLMAGNQVGKSYCGAAEMAIHMTGLYPDWWEGRRWDRPIRAWGAGVTSEVVRDTIQRLLVGDPANEESWGTGLIPGDVLQDTSRRPGVPNALAAITTKHTSGGISSLVLKSFDQGRAKFQGDTIDLGWLDEEPPLEIYTEMLTRTNATSGLTYMTFTPLMGMSKTVKRFMGQDVERR